MNNFLNSQYLHKHQSILNHNKKRLTQEQVKRLEASFDSTKKLEPEQKLQLAKELGVLPRQIAIWYQNRRARWKNQSLELDYTALQLKLETTLAEKKQIEKENERLKNELKKVNEMLIAIKMKINEQVQEELAPKGIIHCSISSGNCEGGGSSSYQEDVMSCSWVNNNNNNNNNSSSCSNNNNKHINIDNNDNDNSESNVPLDELYACLMGGEEESKYSLSWQSGKDLWVWKN
ncbi:unnamed protein product [Withania somnifera]